MTQLILRTKTCFVECRASILSSVSPRLNVGERVEIVVQQQSHITGHMWVPLTQEKLLINNIFTVHAMYYKFIFYTSLN